MKLVLPMLVGFALGTLLANLSRFIGRLQRLSRARAMELRIQEQQAQHELMMKQLIALSACFLIGYVAGSANRHSREVRNMRASP